MVKLGFYSCNDNILCRVFEKILLVHTFRHQSIIFYKNFLINQSKNKLIHNYFKYKSDSVNQILKRSDFQNIKANTTHAIQETRPHVLFRHSFIVRVKYIQSKHF
jgi:hypothetical protein